jgi:hypothetical protein
LLPIEGAIPRYYKFAAATHGTMGVDPVWAILEPKAWMDGDWEIKVLGAVVRDYYNPTNRKPDDPARYHPDESSFITRELYDFVLSREATNSTTTEAKLTSLLGAKVVSSSSTEIDLFSKTVKLRRLDQDEDYWDKLKDDPSLQKVLPSWIQKSGRKYPEVCLVVGIAICEDVEVEWDKTRIAKRQADGELPLDVILSAAAGSPLPLPIGANVTATIAKEKTQVYVFKSKQKKKSIFALELKVIQRKGWRKPRLELGRGPRVEAGHQLAGSDDDEDEDDEDIDVADLVLHELSGGTVS